MKILPYRPNVCIFLLNKKNELLIAERLNYNNIWQLPQGGVEPEFTVEENVLKETNEETGISKSLLKIEKKLLATHTYDFGGSETPEYFKNKFRGQAQTFWIVRFLGKDSDINLATEEPEFQNYQWIDPSHLLDIAEHIRIPGYSKALPEVLDFIKNIKSK